MNGENHILLQELCLILDIFICFGIPIGGYALLHKKSVKGMKIFLLGVASFVVSQVCIRLPKIDSRHKARSLEADRSQG